MTAAQAEAELDKLTPKQREFMELACRPGGITTKEMALELAISPSAVDQRANAARLKLGVHDGNTAEAVRIYIALKAACGVSTGVISQVGKPASLIDEPWRDDEVENQTLSLPSRRVSINHLNNRRRILAIPLIAIAVMSAVMVVVAMAVALAPGVSKLVVLFGG